MSKRFLVSVGEVVAMQDNNIVFTAKTLLDSGITVETSNTEIRGGQGNQLQAIYYHSGTFNISLTDTQFRLPYIAFNTGAEIANGGNIWSQEAVTLNGKSGAITGQATNVDGQSLAVWVEYNDTHYTLPLDPTTKTFTTDGTPIPANSTLCVKYLCTKDSAQTIKIPANIVPDRLRLFITANLYGDVSGKGYVGQIQVEVPVAQLSGAQEISMTADGTSNTPLTAMALAYTDNSIVGCSSTQYYAKITEYITNSSWHDGVTALAIAGGDFDLASGDTAALRVYAVRNGGSFLCNNANLTFSSATAGVASVGANTGVVTAATEGSALITVKITDQPEIEAHCTVSVTE